MERPVTSQDLELYGGPLRLDGPRTILDALDARQDEQTCGMTFHGHDLIGSFLSYGDIVCEARRRGRCFRSLGVATGGRVALVVADYKEFVLSFLGAISAGLVPVPLALPVSSRQRGYLETVLRIIDLSGARLLVADEPMLETLEGAARPPNLHATLGSSALSCDYGQYTAFGVFARPEPNDLCFLQFTSGSTAQPKGVAVSHRNLMANVTAVVTRLQVSSQRDRLLSWLPLYHDMGLIGFVFTPVVRNVNCDLFPTSAFVWRPASWMQLAHRYRSTITFAPNFAYGLAARRQKDAAELDLTRLRVAGCGAEPVSAPTLRAFAQALSPAGFDARALMPSYGLAEHTLAVSFDSPLQPLRTLAIERTAYEQQRVVRLVDEDAPADQTLEVVSCGTPFAGHSVGIADTDGQPLPAGMAGEILVSGPSATRGYFGDDAATSRLCRGRWLRTGDVGFIHDGRLYVSGRLKDLVVINGRNLCPHDLEWQLEQLSGLRKGRVVAFGIPLQGSERLVIAAETLGKPTPQLRDAVITRVTELTGVAPHEVVFVGANRIPQTSSGKLQRQRARALYLDSSLDAGLPAPGAPPLH